MQIKMKCTSKVRTFNLENKRFTNHTIISQIFPGRQQGHGCFGWPENCAAKIGTKFQQQQPIPQPSGKHCHCFASVLRGQSWHHDASKCGHQAALFAWGGCGEETQNCSRVPLRQTRVQIMGKLNFFKFFKILFFRCFRLFSGRINGNWTGFLFSSFYIKTHQEIVDFPPNCSFIYWLFRPHKLWNFVATKSQCFCSKFHPKIIFIFVEKFA